MRPDTEPLLRRRQNRENSSERRAEMEARAEHQTKRQYNAIYAVTVVLAAVFFVLLLVWLIHFRGGFAWESDPNKQFNWHPLLMWFGLICLYSQSMLIFRTGRNVVKKQLKIVHAVMHFGAYLSSVIGLVAAFDSHNAKNTPNLYTFHSWIGIVTVVLFALQFVVGFTAFLFPGFPSSLRAAIMPIHTSCGAAIFLFALVAAMTGLKEKTIWVLDKTYEERPPESWVINVMSIALLFFGALVLYLVGAPEYKRVPIPEDQIPLEETHDH